MLRSVLICVLLVTIPTVIVGQDEQSPAPLPPNPQLGPPSEPELLPPIVKAFTLADLEAIAVQHNPSLAVAAARLSGARGKQLQAGLYPNPMFGYHAMQMGNLGTAGQQGGFISQQFITAGKRRLDRAIATQETNAVRFQLHAQQQRVLSDVRVRFYEARVAQRRVQLTEELTHIGEQLVHATNVLVQGRQGTENDLLQAEIQADESQILLDNARNEHLATWRRLVAILGLPNMQLTPLAGDLDGSPQIENWEQCYATVLLANPHLQAARTRVDRARIAWMRARREPIPNIDLAVSHRHNNITEDNVTNVQVGIPVPIFDRNQGNIRHAEAEWRAANHEVQRIELDLQDQLAVAYRRYANARQQADRYGQRMIPRAQRSLRLVTDAYEKGQAEYLTLLTAQQTYIQVNLAHLDALGELRTASSVIQGQLLTNSLAKRR